MSFLGLGKKKKLVLPPIKGDAPVFPSIPKDIDTNLDKGIGEDKGTEIPSDLPLITNTQNAEPTLEGLDKKESDFEFPEPAENEITKEENQPQQFNDLETPPLPSGSEEMISEAEREKNLNEEFSALPEIGEENESAKEEIFQTPKPQQEREPEQPEKSSVETAKKREELPSFTSEDVALAKRLEKTKDVKHKIWTNKDKERIEKAVKYPLLSIQEEEKTEGSPYIEAREYLKILKDIKDIRKRFREMDSENKTALRKEEEKDEYYDSVVNNLNSVQEICINIEKEISRLEL